MATKIFFRSNEILIDTIPTPFVAGSLVASFNGTAIDITRYGSPFVFASPLWSDVADIDGNTFPTPDAAMAYLANQFSMQASAGSPQRNYAIPVSDGQTTLPISPAPVDVNTINLAVNGVLYAPPDIAVSALAVAWQGAFALSATDAVRVIYF